MKYLRQIIFILPFLLLQNANAVVWFADGITGTVGNSLGATAPYLTASSQIKIVAGNLTYPNLADPSPVGNEFTISGASASSTYCQFNGSAITGGSVYYAFLAQCTTQPSAGGNYVTDLHTSANIGSSDPADIYVKASGTGFVMGVRKNGGSATYASSPTVLNLNTTYLVVLKYTFNGGTGDDTVTLYINPTPGGLESGATAEVTVTGGTDATGLQYCGWKSQSSATGGAWIFDTLRFASSWGEVTPASTAPPSIINDLTNQAVSLGQNVTFSVDAGGTLPLTYLWYYNTNTLLSAGTNSTLTLTDVQLSDAGGYSVIVTNSYGSATSIVAQLTVNIFAPSINNDPQDQSAFVGQDTSFSVQVSGTAPLNYQWYYNTNTVLTNATSSVLTLTNVQLTDAGGYSVVVTNGFGSVTSAVAQLTVSLPMAPSIITQPQDQANILPGATATFSVQASGSESLSYQWYYNTNTVLTNATDSILTIINVQLANVGSYSVVINNSAGSTNSANAFLTVNTSPVAPVFSSQPASLVELAGSSASFTAVAGGTAPISYQWSKNETPIPGATSSTLNLSNVQTSDDGSYTLTATNSVGSATSNPAQLTVTTAIPLINSAYNLTGFAQSTTGGGVIATNDPAYVQVYTPLDFANALQSAYKTAGSVKVIEIMNDLSLGWNEVGATVQAVGPFRANTTPLLHPVLLTVGESLIDIKPRSGLTIFSANGATIKHCNFNIKSCHNIIVRNLKFDENFEWDENTKGQYDRNDWDFITVGNGGAVSNLWVDHCTFTKSYDGLLDTKAGCSAITISWCRYIGDDGATNPNSWVWQQINSLESNKTAHPMYNFLRTHGYSTTNIVTIMQAHDKTHLAGQNDLDSNNATISMTFHHLWIGVWDRCVPRLRAGNVHDYNIYVDDTQVLAARRLRDSIAATMSTADQNTLNNTYSFEPPVNGTISTENGAILVEKSVYIDCLWPLRNNQTAPSNPAYTGKIKALDCIYQFDSTTVRGNSTDPGSPMGPFQAPIIPFSWNPASGAPGGQLPYTYTPDDPAQLQAIVTSPTAGAGAGVLTWAKTNWLMTSYPATAPIIVAAPQSQTNAPGQSVTFTVVAGGSAPLSYQWYFNTNTLIANATNAFLTLADVQATNAGIYSVTVSNSAGSVPSAYALLTVAAANTAPTLSPIADTNINAGVTLVVTGVATDTDTPPQTLTFSLLNAPTNATLDTDSGVFTWRPLVTQANTTNLVTIEVSDSGTPSLSATQSFNVIINPLTQPSVTSSAWVGGQMQLTVAGEVGPDYAVQASTNLSLTNWQTIFTTNSPPTPFNWIDTNTDVFPIRFYRVVLGPPLP
jgi:pectate lyase